MLKKHRDPCILFLEDSFAESHAEKLRAAGYPQVERFRLHFQDAKGHIEESVKDPRIIRFCNTRSWILVTTDSNMEKTHCELIKTTQIVILATAHNHAEDMNDWVEGLIAAKPELIRRLKKTQRPWCATFARNGKLNVHEVRAEKKARRTRPNEI